MPHHNHITLLVRLWLANETDTQTCPVGCAEFQSRAHCGLRRSTRTPASGGGLPRWKNCSRFSNSYWMLVDNKKGVNHVEFSFSGLVRARHHPEQRWSGSWVEPRRRWRALNHRLNHKLAQLPPRRPCSTTIGVTRRPGRCSMQTSVSTINSLRDSVPFIIGTPTNYCNPVKKKHGDLTTTIIHPNAHLVLYEIGQPSFKLLKVRVKNQFGRQDSRSLHRRCGSQCRHNAMDSRRQRISTISSATK